MERPAEGMTQRSMATRRVVLLQVDMSDLATLSMNLRFHPSLGLLTTSDYSKKTGQVKLGPDLHEHASSMRRHLKLDDQEL